jgi:hypothetical protein
MDPPLPSAMPRNRRVAPTGMLKNWVRPEPSPVRPSPMKKG